MHCSMHSACKDHQLPGNGVEMVLCLLQMLYIVAVVVLFPGSILALAAGAVFGLALGSLLVWTGTVLGQTLAFIIGRCSNPACSSWTHLHAVAVCVFCFE